MKFLLDHDKNIYLYNNNEIKKLKFTKNYENVYKPRKEDYSILKELCENNLANSVYAKENYDEEEIDITKLNIKRSEYLKFNIYDSIFDNELIYTKLDSYNNLHVNNIPFKIRDTDIKKALLNNTISPIIASAIISARNTLEEGRPLYKHFKKLKKNKVEFRDIYEPDEDFKIIMQKLNKVLQRYFDSKQSNVKTNQFAYIKERNIVDNAEIHRDNQIMVKVDISKFFESIKIEYFEKYLKFLCRNKELRNEFMRYITTNNLNHDPELSDYNKDKYKSDTPVKIRPFNKNKIEGLYMGNPISGTIANILMYKVCITLQNIFNSKNMKISIYSDDITVSGNEKISREMVVAIIKHVFQKYNLDFKLKETKTKKVSKQNRRVCGVTINHENKLTTRRRDYEEARIILYKLSRGESINMSISTFVGKLNYYYYIDETGKYYRLFKKYSKILNEIGFKY